MAHAKEALGQPPRGHTYMSNGELHWLAKFIWGIADDVLRDLYVRGKYRDVILPMTVLRRLDAVLEPTKKAVLDMKAILDKEGITSQDLALRQAAGQAFYNTSKFTLRDLKARASQQQRPSASTTVGTRRPGFSSPSTSLRFERSTTLISTVSYSRPRWARSRRTL